jgi:hypothetical protein
MRRTARTSRLLFMLLGRLRWGAADVLVVAAAVVRHCRDAAAAAAVLVVAAAAGVPNRWDAATAAVDKGIVLLERGICW